MVEWLIERLADGFGDEVLEPIGDVIKDLFIMLLELLFSWML